MAQKIGLNSKIKQNLLSPDWKICSAQKSATCLIAEEKQHFTGRICSQCVKYHLQLKYIANKAKMNKQRCINRRKQKERERTEREQPAEIEKKENI